MIDLVFRILYLALWLFDVALLIYVAMSWLRPTANRWSSCGKLSSRCSTPFAGFWWKSCRPGGKSSTGPRWWPGCWWSWCGICSARCG